jgi:hypothetical protein
MKEKNKNDDLKHTEKSANPDPITGEKGSHPVGTGLGAAAGGVGGAAAGAAAGAAIGATTTGPAAPIGGIVGAAIGAVAGGLAGKGIAEQVNPTEEEAYWRSNYRERPYVYSGAEYDEYGPAYQYGWEARAKNPDKEFTEVEPDLARDWERNRGSSKLDWQQARAACHDAWDRCVRTPPPEGRDISGEQRPDMK